MTDSKTRVTQYLAFSCKDYLDDIKKKYQLDFDDSYQLAIAQDHYLKIATMDFDFKKVSDTQKVLFL